MSRLENIKSISEETAMNDIKIGARLSLYYTDPEDGTPKLRTIDDEGPYEYALFAAVKKSDPGEDHARRVVVLSLGCEEEGVGPVLAAILGQLLTDQPDLVGMALAEVMDSEMRIPLAVQMNNAHLNFAITVVSRRATKLQEDRDDE